MRQILFSSLNNGTGKSGRKISVNIKLLENMFFSFVLCFPIPDIKAIFSENVALCFILKDDFGRNVAIERYR